MKIRILVTGGTFDKEYDELTGALFFRNTHLPEMLRLGRSKLDVLMQTVCMMDSLEMDAEHRAQITATLTQIGVTPPDIDGWTFFRSLER